MKAELKAIDQQLANEPERIKGYTREEFQAINDWWEDLNKRAVTVPVKGKIHPVIAAFYQDPEREDQALMVNASAYNDVLTKIEAEVRLWWDTRTITIKKGKNKGKTQNRYKWVKGELRIKGREPVVFSVILRNSLGENLIL
jgi:hypothetical protein